MYLFIHYVDVLCNKLLEAELVLKRFKDLYAFQSCMHELVVFKIDSDTGILRTAEISAYFCIFEKEISVDFECSEGKLQRCGHK